MGFDLSAMEYLPRLRTGLIPIILLGIHVAYVITRSHHPDRANEDYGGQPTRSFPESSSLPDTRNEPLNDTTAVPLQEVTARYLEKDPFSWGARRQSEKADGDQVCVIRSTEAAG